MTDKKIDRHIIFIFMLVALLSVAIFVYRQLAGHFIILSLIIFGSLAVLWKDKNIKIAGLAALVILSLINIGVNGIKFGIDFNGGVRLPVVTEKPVDTETMGMLVDTIKKRVNLLGLTETHVRAIGDNTIHVELAKASDQEINAIQQILLEQGVFQGIANGTIALHGEEVYRDSIGPIANPQYDWSVSFSLTAKGAEDFAKSVKGKSDMPLYMFIDRPTDAAVFISIKDLRQKASGTIGDSEIIKAAEDALQLVDNGENKSIPVYILEKTNLSQIFPKTNKTAAIISQAEDDNTKNMIKQQGFVLNEFGLDVISPEPQSRGTPVIDKWEALGLLSAPNLAPEVTSGVPNYNGYSIGGSVRAIDPTQKAAQAKDEIRRIESILKGGALPVQISVGSKTEVPATLGNEALKVSLIGVTAALIGISLFIALRYRSIKIVLPIIAISISELIILLSILGSFTVDLPAIAGIIAAIGVSVDAQIVITDELLKKNDSVHDRIEHAFDIIKTNVIIAIVAMLPLLFSGIVEVINFALSTILGSLLGFLISRPGYAVLVEKILGQEKSDL